MKITKRIPVKYDTNENCGNPIAGNNPANIKAFPRDVSIPNITIKDALLSAPVNFIIFTINVVTNINITVTNQLRKINLPKKLG